MNFLKLGPSLFLLLLLLLIFFIFFPSVVVSTVVSVVDEVVVEVSIIVVGVVFPCDVFIKEFELRGLENDDGVITVVVEISTFFTNSPSQHLTNFPFRIMIAPFTTSPSSNTQQLFLKNIRIKHTHLQGSFLQAYVKD